MRTETHPCEPFRSPFMPLLIIRQSPAKHALILPGYGEIDPVCAQ